MLTQPAHFFSSVAAGTSVVPPLLFALLVGAVILLAEVGVQAGLVAQLGLKTGGAASDSLGLWARLCGAAVLGLLLTPVRLFFLGTLLHVFCVVTRVQRAAWVVSLRAVAYLSPLDLLAVLPAVGRPAALLANLVWAVLAVSAIHRSNRSRAALVVMGPWLLLLCLFVALYPHVSALRLEDLSGIFGAR